jgi:hypothetical protein
MYSNPRHIRDHEIKARFDEDTYRLIEAMAAFHRTQKAVLIRDLVEAALERMTDEQDTDEHQTA